MLLDNPPSPRSVFCFLISVVSVLVAFWLTGTFETGEPPKGLQLAWGIGAVIVFAYMVKYDMFDAEFPDFLIVAYGPGTIIFWVSYWLSFTFSPAAPRRD